MRKIEILNTLAKKGESFTFTEGLKVSGLSVQSFKVLLFRMARDGRIEKVEKGKYIIIPLGAEKGRYTLNEFVIGSLLVNPYCVAYWNALNFYGLTEQIPYTVFMQTTSRKKKQAVEVFGVRYRIVRVNDEKFFGIIKGFEEENETN
jgi:predicted transcriptional regulator of viral defense system